MYRILAEHAEVRERRNQLRHPVYRKPELLATGPNQVWTWDITKLRGPSKGVYYYLYVILDIYSRYVVGWMIAEVESAELAEQLIAETCAKQGVQRAQLTIHADNGSPMIAKIGGHLAGGPGRGEEPLPAARVQRQPVLGGAVQDAQVPADYPERFGSLADARSWARTLLRLVQRPAPPHRSGLADAGRCASGRAETVRQQRQAVLQQAFQAHPERFVRGAPCPARLPEAVWINPPKSGAATTTPAGDRHNGRPTASNPVGGAPAIAPPTDLRYTAVSGTEDRATLRSDLSAVPADGVAGQSRARVSGSAHTGRQPGATLSVKR